jgi:hypothetical protein
VTFARKLIRSVLYVVLWPLWTLLLKPTSFEDRSLGQELRELWR